jgi:hypothetical protein
MDAVSVWTRLTCSRCRYISERPGRAVDGDLDNCGYCGAPLAAVSEVVLPVTADG